MRREVLLGFLAKALTQAPALKSEEARARETGEKDVACRCSEFQFSWLRLRGHLEALFEVDPGEPLSVKEAAAWAALENIAADPGMAALEQVAEEQVACKVGQASLRLLLCLVQPARPYCSPTDLDEALYTAYGLPEPKQLELRLRSGWPTHLLIQAHTEQISQRDVPEAHTWGAWARATSERLLRLEAEAALASFSRITRYEACKGLPERPSCPYASPWDTVFCGQGLGMLQIRWATSPRRCLDVKSGSTANRNVIQLYDCAAGMGTEPNQRFLTPKGQGSIRWATHPGKCLDVQGGAPEPGTKIQLFDCATDAGQTHPNQRFLMPSSGEGQIRWAAHPYLCLSVPEGLQENGAQLCLAECDEYGNHPHQQFLVPPGGYEDLCREGLELAADGPGGPLLAAAAASAALAQVPSPEAGSCAGARRLCSVAQGVGESRLWAQACDALAAGLELEAKPALETLARVAWPLPRLLSSAARPPKLPQDIPLGEQSLPGISEGSCACDMSLWLPEEARAVAAAQRVLEDINDARNTARGQGISADKIIQAMLSSSASAACRNWDSRLLTAATLVEDAWLLDDALGAEDFKAAARRLVAARSSAWDANLCLPGVVALGLVCSTREFVQNQPSHATDAARAAVACASALTGCLDMGQIVGGDGSREELEERRLAFVMDWPELAPWLLHPQRFYHEVQSPVLASDRWWRRGSENPLPWANVEEKALDIPPRRADGVAATSCAGVWEPSPDHFCHQLARGGAAADHSDGMPRTVVLGVGLMKAGTTAVWHALAAAGNFSMGLDCEALSQAQAPLLKVARREAPLERLVDLCFNDLFRWELAKDAQLTPVARRLASAWPALSKHGQQLQLYFVVRNPFDFVRSFLGHMGLDANVSSAEDQVFSWVAGRFPSHFSPGKQLYLDVSQEGLRYTGYVDAAVQRWALTVMST